MRSIKIANSKVSVVRFRDTICRCQIVSPCWIYHLTLLIYFFCGRSLIFLIFSIPLTIYIRLLQGFKSLKDQIYGRRSQSSSKPNLFSLSDDCLAAYLDSFFDIDSFVNIDTAVTNVQERLLWLKFLSTSNTIVAYASCPLSARWLLRRGIMVRHIKIRGQKNHGVTGRFFLELVCLSYSSQVNSRDVLIFLHIITFHLLLFLSPSSSPFTFFYSIIVS